MKLDTKEIDNYFGLAQESFRQNTNQSVLKAKEDILKAIESHKNHEKLLNDNIKNITAKELFDIYQKYGEVYNLAASIFIRINRYSEEIKKFYNKYHYYKLLYTSDYRNASNISVYSFRRFNEYTKVDLINNTITLAPPQEMNDPFDTLFTHWRKIDNQLQIAPNSRQFNVTEENFQMSPLYFFCKSFDDYRIRSFCSGDESFSLSNTLMWSHYANSHEGFCIKYKLSRHFIEEEKNNNSSHMIIKKIIYTDAPVDLKIPTIDINTAFFLKAKDWSYENEIRLIRYDPNNKDQFPAIELDSDSAIEGVYFGYRCPEMTKQTVMNIVRSHYSNAEFFQMETNYDDILNLKPVRI